MSNLINPTIVTIKVFGVGGAGNNAINRMAEQSIEGVELYAINTDDQVLRENKAENTLLLGVDITKGMGAGGDPSIGKKCAEESRNDIINSLRGADMVFIAAGMGGGTGTGAAPIIAEEAHKLGILTVGIVTKPFTFEGKRRNANAVEGLQALRPYCDSLIVISNDQIIQMMGQEEFSKAFKKCDDILCHSVEIITNLILKPALINLDFNDVRAVMKDKGTALIGMGKGFGENKANDAARQAISSPLLEISIEGAKNAIVFINGGKKMTPLDFHEAVEIVKEATHNNDVNLIFGVRQDDELEDEMQVTVIATEFENNDLHMVSKPISETFDINEISIDNFAEREDAKNDSNNVNSFNSRTINSRTSKDETSSNKEEGKTFTSNSTNDKSLSQLEKKGINKFLPNFLKRRK